jgi:hypothetical protein
MKAKLILFAIVSLTLFSCQKKKTCELDHTGTLIIHNQQSYNAEVTVIATGINTVYLVKSNTVTTISNVKSGTFYTSVVRADTKEPVYSPSGNVYDCTESNCHL